MDGLHLVAQAYLSGWPWPTGTEPGPETYQLGDRVPGWIDETN